MLWLLLGCAEPLTGSVKTADGAPISGARVMAPDCEAVSGPEGTFQVHCSPASRVFEVSHPAFTPAKVTWAKGPVLATLSPIPTAPGVYVQRGDALLALTSAALTRTGDETTGWKFCFPDAGEPVTAAPGALTLLDNHEVDWRLFALDADRCAYELQHGNGEWWTSPSKGIPVTRERELAPGRDWLSVTLEAGDYALLDWYAGAPVPEGEGYRARRLRVGEG